MAQRMNHFWAVFGDLISYFHAWLQRFLFCATVTAWLRCPLAPAGPRTIIAHSSASATLSKGRHFGIGFGRMKRRNVSGAAERYAIRQRAQGRSCKQRVRRAVTAVRLRWQGTDRCVCVCVWKRLLQVAEQGVSWSPRSLISIFVIICASCFSFHPWNGFMHNFPHWPWWRTDGLEQREPSLTC